MDFATSVYTYTWKLGVSFGGVGEADRNVLVILKTTLSLRQREQIGSRLPLEPLVIVQWSMGTLFFLVARVEHLLK